MERKSIKRLLNLIAFCLLTLSIALAGCSSASLPQGSAKPEIKQEITVPEEPFVEPEIPGEEPEEEVKPPVIKLPDNATPPAKAEGEASQSEVYAKFEYTPIDEEHCAVSCTNKNVATYADIPLQAVVDGKVYYVHEIAERGFENCLRLKTVEIVLNIRKIRDYAFFNCNTLESVLINKTFGMVTEIGYDAFAHNYNLKEINLSDVRKIDDVAFINCKSLTSVNAPQLTEIGDQAFCGCENIESVYIPRVKNIESCAFGSCPKLSEIVIPRSAEVLGSGIFYNNSTQVKIARGVNKQNWDRNWNDRNSVTEVIENWVVQAELKFTPINDTECSVECTNTDAVMHAEIPSTAIIEGKEYTVTEIADYGFSYCPVLESFVLPESVKIIGKTAFANCELLSDITLSDLTLINNNAFRGCQNLTDIIIDNVERLGRAFYNCTNLKSVKISNVTEISNSAFAVGSRALESADITNVDKIGSNIFRGCIGLTEVNFDGVNEIGQNVFYGCTSLSKVNLKDVKSIGYGVFTNCTGLKDIIIPESVEQMGSNVFNGCDTQVKAVADSQPEGWDTDWNTGNANQNVIWGWFEGKAVLGYTAIAGTENCSVSCLNKDEVTFAEIPSTAIIDGKEYTVTEIADHGFSYCPILESFILPDSVKIIGPIAFLNCELLSDISLSDLTLIDNNAFNGCNNLIHIEINDVEEIGQRVFAECKSLESADIKNVPKMDSFVFYRNENLTRVNLCNVIMGKYMFYGCTSLSEVNLYDVTTINNAAFAGCTNLTEVDLKDVSTINSNAFLSCKNLTEVDLKNVTTIGASAFANCTGLTKVHLMSAEIIGSTAFRECTGLKDIIIPESVEQMGSSVFNGCNTQIKAVADSQPEGWHERWNNGNANQNVIWGWFEGKAVFEYSPIEGTENCSVKCTNRLTVTYAEVPSTAIIDGKLYTVTQLASGAFGMCNYLETLIIPESVTVLNPTAVSNCKVLKQLYLPNVKELGRLAVAHCESLEILEIPKATSIDTIAFSMCTALKEIIIPISVESMGEKVFSGCDTQLYIVAEQKPEGWADNWNDGNNNQDVIWGWKDEKGRFNYKIISESECEVSLINRVTAVEAYIPATVMIDGKQYFVTAIAENGFKDCTLLKKVAVPYTLKYIGELAFSNCIELQSFSLFNTQTIGAGAFANCPKLERLFIPKSVKFVGQNVLYGNDTDVFIRASSDKGWATSWNGGNTGYAEFDSKYILPVEIYDWE